MDARLRWAGVHNKGTKKSSDDGDDDDMRISRVYVRGFKIISA